MVRQYSTNKYGEFTSAELHSSLYMSGAVTAKLSKKPSYSGFLGFGAAITGSSCYNLSKMDAEERGRLLRSIYSKEGLGLSVARLTIGSSDYSAELYTYDDVEGDESLEHFSVKRDDEYIVPMIKEILQINPDLYIFASPWSPPAWMKTGNSVCGGHMRGKFIDSYAEYFIRYIKEYDKRGIKIRAVTPQNEPETQQFGLMPACIWNPEHEAEFVSVLRKKLSEIGLEHVEIWMNDHSFAYSDKVDWQICQYPELERESGGIAFHYYDGSIEQTEYLLQKYPRLRMHFTEGGPRLYDHYDSDWCKWGIMMAKTLNSRYYSFTGWNLLLDETGGPNIGPFFCGGLVTRNRLSGELSYSGQYKALRHFSSFINKDSKISAVEFDKNGYGMFSYPKDAKTLVGSFVENTDGSAALMLVNPNPDKSQVQYYYSGKWYYIELLPETLTTVNFEK